MLLSIYGTTSNNYQSSLWQQSLLLTCFLTFGQVRSWSSPRTASSSLLVDAWVLANKWPFNLQENITQISSLLIEDMICSIKSRDNYSLLDAPLSSRNAIYHLINKSLKPWNTFKMPIRKLIFLSTMQESLSPSVVPKQHLPKIFWFLKSIILPQ